jgi:hypothetical protein
MSENAQRRSDDRERRRSAARDRKPGGTNDELQHDEGLQQAVRAAAAAAAVGAAVGAARAFATRGDDLNDADEPGPTERESQQQPVSPEQAARQPVQDEPHAQSDAQNEPKVRSHVPQRTPKDESRPRRGASASDVRSIANRARDQLRDLHGGDAESVTSLERIGDGWRVTFEVLEVERIPSSTDVLATYVVEVDDESRLLSFERVRRYARAQADLGDGR